MKKIISSLVMAILALVSVNAQQISVVSPEGETTIYRSLPEAIEGAADGSVVYLPGGTFSINNSVIIAKKLTIIGVGPKVNNIDGNTIINGNLIFSTGSSGSAVIACFLTGGLDIGYNNTEVNDILIRYCCLRGMNVSSKCRGNNFNQNYFRWEWPSDYSRNTFNGSSCTFTNNVSFPPIENLNGGIISNNIIIQTWYNCGIYSCDNSLITDNIIFGGHSGSNQIVSGNMTPYEWGENCINVEGVDWKDIFVNYSAPFPSTDFHFTEKYKQYENKTGIYGGTGFNDNQLAPVPYIIYKDIPEQTDSEGKLKIQIRVKANQ